MAKQLILLVILAPHLGKAVAKTPLPPATMTAKTRPKGEGGKKK